MVAVRQWSEGEVGGILIFAEDITHRKQMEEALSDMTRKLVEAHEQERARLARELHDDVTQRLAMLAIEIEQMHELRPEIPSEMRGRALELSKRAKEISSDIQSLSRHPAAIDREFLIASALTGIKTLIEPPEKPPVEELV